MSEHQGDQGRSETTPFGQGSSGSSSWGGQDGQSSPGYGAAAQPDPYAQPQPYAGYDQGGYQQGSYQQGGYDQASYQQGGYQQGGYQTTGYQQGGYEQGGQQQGAYQQAGYAQPYGYGPAAPAKPGTVITSAVFGFIFGALGVLVSGALVIFGAILAGASSTTSGLDDDFPGLGSFLGGALGAAGGVVLVVGLLAVAWTVVTIWGSVWALTGRSRVMLIVAGSISIAVTGLNLVGTLSTVGDGYGAPTGGQVVTVVLFFAAAVAIVVLLCLSQSAQFFAAHRALRGR